MDSLTASASRRDSSYIASDAAAASSNLGLDNAVFVQPVAITLSFGTLASFAFSATDVSVTFSLAEPAELYFGNPLTVSGQRD